MHCQSSDFPKEVTHSQQIQKIRVPFGFIQLNCLMLYPILFPNKGPELEQYFAEEEVGMSNFLNWIIHYK